MNGTSMPNFVGLQSCPNHIVSRSDFFITSPQQAHTPYDFHLVIYQTSDPATDHTVHSEFVSLFLFHGSASPERSKLMNA